MRLCPYGPTPLPITSNVARSDVACLRGRANSRTRQAPACRRSRTSAGSCKLAIKDSIFLLRLRLRPRQMCSKPIVKVPIAKRWSRSPISPTDVGSRSAGSATITVHCGRLVRRHSHASSSWPRPACQASDVSPLKSPRLATDPPWNCHAKSAPAPGKSPLGRPGTKPLARLQDPSAWLRRPKPPAVAVAFAKARLHLAIKAALA